MRSTDPLRFLFSRPSKYVFPRPDIFLAGRLWGIPSHCCALNRQHDSPTHISPHTNILSPLGLDSTPLHIQHTHSIYNDNISLTSINVR